MFGLDLQALSLRLISAWLVALAFFWFFVLATLWPSIRFAFSSGTVLVPYQLWAFGFPALFCALALVAGIGAFLERQWYRYFLYTLTGAVVAKWIWSVFKAGTLTFSLATQYPTPIPLPPIPWMVYIIVFAGAQPAMALVVLSAIAFRMRAHFRHTAMESHGASYGVRAVPISLWVLLGGSFLLVWIPHVLTNFTTTVISLHGIRGYDGLVLLLYILAGLGYPLVYLVSLIIAKRKLRISRDEGAALVVLNLPLVNIVVGTASWFKVLARYLDFR